MNNQKQNKSTANELINTAMTDIADVQGKLDNMLCLQMNIGSFMDDVMEMSPIKDMNSVMKVQIGRTDANCFTNIVLDYLNNISEIMNNIGDTLDRVFELNKTGGKVS